MKLKIKRLDERAIIPKFATDGAACFDLHAIIDGPNAFATIDEMIPWTFKTGLSIEIPPGYVMLVFSRSGHGFKRDVRLANCVGVVDSDYRGEIMVKLSCDGSAPFTINHGDRIAQAMIVALPVVQIEEVDELSDTARGAGGFGSTGA
jgi:dUTP pyrophosphatase